MPRNGIFEFDFMMLIDVPDTKNVLPDDQLVKLLEWFKIKAEDDLAEPYALAMAFASISEYLNLRSDQLGLFVDLVDGKLSFNFVNRYFVIRPSLED